MFTSYVFLFVASPVLSAVIDEKLTCSVREFACGDGNCVPSGAICDGVENCTNGADEQACSLVHPTNEDVTFKRSRRQSSGCRKNQWRCKDGTCISFDGKCDGVIDCHDKSDETFPLCRKMKCQSNWFQCTYGACVDGTAPCNGVSECADKSDELQPQCFNTTREIQGRFTCDDGTTIAVADRCDGKLHCPDGSDENIRACSAFPCAPYLFRCAYGACVDKDSDCDNKLDCADGSDESDELCNRISSATTTTIRSPSDGACVLPPYPDHGRYSVAGLSTAKPGQNLDTVYLNVTCNIGYGVLGKSTLYCYNGVWSGELPKCVRFCKLSKHPSVEYRCLITGDNQEGSRNCQDFEPVGTIVRPECKSPNYYYAGVLSFMRCIDGSWDYVAICSPECGRVTPLGEQLVIGGRLAERGELPWHAGIYRKTTTPYMQICGGSLVSTTVVISAAHCFWKDAEKLLAKTKFAVAVGKLYRPWNNPRDTDAQKSDVKEIRVPSRFQGSAANFQDDIALVILTTSVVYQTYVRPVCVDFDINFDRRQLQHRKMGKVAGWGLTAENGNASQILKVVDIPYVTIEECIAVSPPGFREYITSDKICAGYRNGTALCKGDSGGGLVFPESDRGTERYYLRGIVSTAPNNENICNAFALTTFTQITKHEHFIKEYL